MSFKVNAALPLALVSLSAGGLCAQDAEPKMAPLNPAFIEWQARQKEGRAEEKALAAQRRGAEARPLGFVPPPLRRFDAAGPITEMEAMVKAGLKAYPASYDLRALGHVTPIRNQNPFGTCWAFAACASMESNAHGLVHVQPRERHARIHKSGGGVRPRSRLRLGRQR